MFLSCPPVQQFANLNLLMTQQSEIIKPYFKDDSTLIRQKRSWLFWRPRDHQYNVSNTSNITFQMSTDPLPGYTMNLGSHARVYHEYLVP